jgi:release factor glutamine methyltransferase
MTLREVLAEGTALLSSFHPGSCIDTPSLDASLLLADLLHTDRTGLIMAGPEPVPDHIREQYARLLERRRSGECVAQILGRREFRGLDFTVTPAVLVPRPDTETLVEAALSRIDHRPVPENFTLLDLCTGSGAVAVSLKYERPFLRVYASDISPEALEVARGNAEKLLGGRGGTGPKNRTGPSPKPARGGTRFKDASGFNPRITFFESDLFEGLDTRPGLPRRFHLITANPPYIPRGVIPSLAAEVRREPLLALDGGEDGLSILRRIISQAGARLYPGSMLLLEADPRQMDTLKGLLASEGYKEIEIYKDLSGLERVIGGVTAP